MPHGSSGPEHIVRHQQRGVIMPMLTPNQQRELERMQRRNAPKPPKSLWDKVTDVLTVLFFLFLCFIFLGPIVNNWFKEKPKYVQTISTKELLDAAREHKAYCNANIGNCN